MGIQNSEQCPSWKTPEGLKFSPAVFHAFRLPIRWRGVFFRLNSSQITNQMMRCLFFFLSEFKSDCSPLQSSTLLCAVDSGGLHPRSLISIERHLHWAAGHTCFHAFLTQTGEMHIWESWSMAPYGISKTGYSNDVEEKESNSQNSHKAYREFHRYNSTQRVVTKFPMSPPPSS